MYYKLNFRVTEVTTMVHTSILIPGVIIPAIKYIFSTIVAFKDPVIVYMPGSVLRPVYEYTVLK